jgi:hypothetical protein
VYQKGTCLRHNQTAEKKSSRKLRRHEKSWGCQTPRKSLVAGNSDLTRCQVNEIKNLSRYGACVEARFCRRTDWRRTDWRRTDNLP